MCPVFDFYSEYTGKIISVLVPLSAPDKDRHEQIGDDGLVYKRVYSAPNAAVDSRIVAGSKEEFRKITEKPGMKVGDIWKVSEEMHQHRADKNGGHDEVREKFYKDYEKKFKRPHDDVLRRQIREKNEKLKKEWGISVEDQ